MNNLKWIKNSKTFTEKYFIIISVTCCAIVLLILFNLPFIKISLKIQILILIIAIPLSCIPYFYLFYYYCIFPDVIGIDSKTLFFKKGNKEYHIDFDNIISISNHGRLLDIQLRKPKHHRAFWIDEKHIKMIKNKYNLNRRVC